MEQGRKILKTIHKHRIYTNVKKNLPQFEKHLRKCFPSSQDPLCASLCNLNDDFQFSKLSVKRDLENELMSVGGEGIVRGVSDGHAHTIFKIDN